jgi:tryptophan synthase alpha chain
VGTTRIDDTFRRARDAGRKVLVAYLCVGDPSPEESAALAHACMEAGADVLELGVPFSDPSADGPAIARAGQRALRAGGGLRATLAVAARLRAELPDTPLVLFGYLNPIVVMGEHEAVRAARDAGIDALLSVDLPLGECPELREEAAANDLAIVPLVAPTSAASRAEAIRGGGAAGFLYYVSVAGVTGGHAAPLAEASVAARRWSDATGLPAVVGFGIDTPAKAREAAAHADGVVVGTAIVRAIEGGADAAARLAGVRALVGRIRAALDG